jgi:predicted Zn-dependent peptidase
MKSENVKVKSFVGWIFLSLTISTSLLFGQTPIPPPKQEKLLNGLKVLMWNDAKADKVAIKIRIHSGSAFDPQGKEGLMQMLANNLFPNEQASREFFAEDLGGSLEITTNYDYIQINASSRPDAFVTMLETIATAVSNPAIDKETTAKLRSALLAKIATLETDPSYVADQAVAKRLFGTFPYGRPQNGTTDSLKKIEYGDLIDAKNRFLTADNATIAISGNFDKATGSKAVRRYLGGWLKADKKVPATFRQPDAPPAEVLTLPSPNPDVSALRFAIRGTSRSGKDFAASRAFATIFESRLKARAPAAFASQVFVKSDSYLLPGMLTIGFAGDKNDFGSGNGKIDANELMSRPKAMWEPITEAEFQSAKAANISVWNTRTGDLFWLDNDTYKTESADADKLAFENLTIADVRAFAGGLKNTPMAAVLVNTPSAAK